MLQTAQINGLPAGCVKYNFAIGAARGGHMEKWYFYQNDVGLWCWRRTDPNGVVAEGAKCFESRTDCIADAMRHGYLACDSARSASHTRPRVV